VAQRHHDLTASASAAGPVNTGDALEGYLRAQATEFLRALRQHREAGSAASASHGTSHSPVSGAEERNDAARALRRSARRISGTLHTFRPLLDADWYGAFPDFTTVGHLVGAGLGFAVGLVARRRAPRR